MFTTIPTPPFSPLALISTASVESLADVATVVGGNPGAAAWPTANLAIFVPFELYTPTTFIKVGVYNGVVSGNIDLGIYDINGNRMASLGSTAAAGSNGIQAGTISVLLSAGIYFLALVCDNTTITIIRWSAIPAVILEAAGVQQMASAFPLPATATFANPTNAYLPYILAGLNSVI